MNSLPPENESTAGPGEVLSVVRLGGVDTKHPV